MLRWRIPARHQYQVSTVAIVPLCPPPKKGTLLRSLLSLGAKLFSSASYDLINTWSVLSTLTGDFTPPAEHEACRINAATALPCVCVTS